MAEAGARDAPAIRERGHRGVESFTRRFSPRPVVGGLLLHLGADEEERLSSVRVGRCEQHRERTAFRFAEDRRAFGPRGVHDRPDVVHPLLEGAPGDAIGKAHPALVERDHARERSESLVEPPVRGLLPHRREVRQGSRDEHDVARPFPVDEVRHVHITAPRVADRWRAAQRRIPVCPSEYRPGCGQTQTPCGPAPTGIRARSLPSTVEMA